MIGPHSTGFRQWQKAAILLLLICVTSSSDAAQRPLGSAGFINDWWVLSPSTLLYTKLKASLPGLDKKALARMKGPPRRHGWKVQCGSATHTPLEKVSVWVQRGVKYHRTTLYAATDLKLQLKVGGDQRSTVWLDGRVVLDSDKPHRALVDDTIVELTLKRGRHRLLVRSIWSRMWWRYQPKLYVRFHDMSNRTPVGLTQLGMPCRLQRDLMVTHRFWPELDGFRVRLNLLAVGTHAALPTGRLPTLHWPGAEVRGRFIRLPGGGFRFDGRVSARRATSGVLKVALAGSDNRVEFGARIALRFRPALHRLLELTTKRLARARWNSSLPLSSRQSVTWLRTRLYDLLMTQDTDERYLARLAQELSRMSLALANGRDPYPARRGHFIKAYRSRLDGRLQYYSIVVPQRYRASRPIPLYISLHGQGAWPQLNIRRVFGLFPKKGENYLQLTRHVSKLPEVNGIVVACNVYRNTGGRYFGRDDILKVLSEVRRHYSIDPRRIYLTGLSMGGLATFHLGLRMPDLWAALATMAGYSSVKRYRELKGVRLAPWEKALLEEREDTNYGINGRYLPLYAWHGTRDEPYHSGAMIEVYKRFGYRQVFETPVWGHRVWRLGYKNGRMFKILARHRRPARPGSVVFRSGSYRFRRSYFVQLNEFDSLQKLATIRATVRGSGLIVRTDNLLGFSIDWRKVAGGRKNTIRIDKQALTPGPADISTHFRKLSGRWQRVTSPKPPAGKKRPGLSGPIPDIRYDRQLFVYGTGDPLQTPVNKTRARFDSRYFNILAGVHFPVKADHDVTARDIERYHLILYGNPGSNRLLKRMIGGLPLSFAGGALHFAGRTYRGPDVGIAMIYPNPLNPARYVLIIAGITWRGTLYSRYLPRWLPDFVIFDRGITRQFGGKVMHRRGTLSAGYFDDFWRFDQRLATMKPWNQKR